MRQPSPPSQQSREMMPPPPRPNKEDREEKVGVEEIGDSLFGSGINLKDEENYMHSVYNNRHHNESFASSNQNNSSFGSSTMSPGNSFNLLTQGTSFGSQDGPSGAFAGTIGQPQSQEDIELEQRRKREAAARELAERRQHHLNHQFLLCNNVRKRMDRLALNQGVSITMYGVFVREPGTNVMVNSANSEGIAAAQDRVNGIRQDERPESVVNQGAPFEQMVSLLSLAAGERIRGLLDEAFQLARARRYGDHGRVVPPEFADVAEGEGKRSEERVVPENVTGSQWDRVPESASSPKDVDMVEAVANGEQDKSSTPQHTFSFQGTLNARLRALADRDRQAETERLKKREKRKRAADAAANGSNSSAEPVDTAALEAPAAAAAPIAEPPKLTKKEQLKQQKEKNSSTEAQLHSTTNQTAAMMALGRKARKYEWMTGGSAAMPTNRFAKPTTSATASGTATPTRAEGATTPGGSAVVGGAIPMVKTGSTRTRAEQAINKALEWGDWREDGVDGQGIQVRDWTLVLERDGREKAALQKVMNRVL